MKTAWEKIFTAHDAPLSAEEDQKAFRELAEASDRVEKLQSSPQHRRIRDLIARKIRELPEK